MVTKKVSSWEERHPLMVNINSKSNSLELNEISIETFWIDLVLFNPLEAEVNLANLTIVVQEAGSLDSSFPVYVELETVHEITLAGKEILTVSTRTRQLFQAQNSKSPGAYTSQVKPSRISDFHPCNI